MIIQVLGNTNLLNQTCVQDCDTCSHRHSLCLIMSDINDGRLDALVELDKIGSCLHTQFRIQVRQWLIHQEDLRFAHNRAAKGDTLSLATGECFRFAFK